jgi:hypothetical protein
MRWHILSTAALGLIFSVSLLPTVAYPQWKEEMADKTEGDLIGAGLTLNDSQQHGFPTLQIGQTVFVMTPNGVADIFPFFPDAGVRIEWGKKSPLFTTHVRDRNGNLVVEVIQNHWRVYPMYAAEKNYKRDALEVQDSAGHLVLQTRILPDRIALQGEWWDTQGRGIRLRNAPENSTQGSEVDYLGRQNQHIESLIKPMFLYPSKEHWRELAGN